MAKFIVDLLFDETTGEIRVVVDYNDPSLTALDLNEAIRDGQVRQEVLEVVGKVFGSELAGSVENGETELVCLDDHPELRDGAGAQQVGTEQPSGTPHAGSDRERQGH